MATTSGCAQLTTSTKVRLLEHPDPSRAPPTTTEETYVGHGFAARWEQRGARLEVVVTELRRCKTQTVVPMIREERTIREVDSGVYWEYGIAAVTAAIATYAFIRPEAFATPLINPEGEIIRDKSAGYMSGGVFSGIAALSLGGGIYDTIRSRDAVEYSDAAARIDGPEGPCGRAEAPWSRHSVALIFADGAEVGGMTDTDGRVVFSLPTFAEGPPAATPEGPATARPGAAAESAAPPGEAASLPFRAALRADDEHAVAIDLRFPYDATREAPHAGSGRVEASPSQLPAPEPAPAHPPPP